MQNYMDNEGKKRKRIRKHNSYYIISYLLPVNFFGGPSYYTSLPGPRTHSHPLSILYFVLVLLMDVINQT